MQCWKIDMQLKKTISIISQRFCKVIKTFLSRFSNVLSRFSLVLIEFLEGFKHLFMSFSGRFYLVLGQFWQIKLNIRQRYFFGDVLRTFWWSFMVIYILAFQHILVLSFQTFSAGFKIAEKYVSSPNCSVSITSYYFSEIFVSNCFVRTSSTIWLLDDDR